MQIKTVKKTAKSAHVTHSVSFTLSTCQCSHQSAQGQWECRLLLETTRSACLWLRWLGRDFWQSTLCWPTTHLHNMHIILLVTYTPPRCTYNKQNRNKWQKISQLPCISTVQIQMHCRKCFVYKLPEIQQYFYLWRRENINNKIVKISILHTIKIQLDKAYSTLSDGIGQLLFCLIPFHCVRQCAMGLTLAYYK